MAIQKQVITTQIKEQILSGIREGLTTKEIRMRVFDDTQGHHDHSYNNTINLLRKL